MGNDVAAHPRRFYHYTTDVAYESILRYGAILPARHLLPIEVSHKLPEYDGKLVFGLLEEAPESWTNNREFPDIWLTLHQFLFATRFGRDSSKMVLLSFDITEQDNAHVVDRAHVVRALASHIVYKRRSERAYEAYATSKVALKDYNSNYILPEVITGSAIAAERLRVERQEDKHQFIAQVYFKTTANIAERRRGNSFKSRLSELMRE